MMKMTIPILMLIFCNIAQAFLIESVTDFNAQGDVIKNLTFTCEKNEIFCKSLCEVKAHCVIPETICQDCMSPKEQVVYSAFNEITTYLNTELSGISDPLMIYFLKNRKFMSITHNSFLNYFNPEEQSEVQKSFNQLCHIKNPQQSFLIASINQNKGIEAIVGIACTDAFGKTSIFPMINNPNFSGQQSNYWQNLAQQARVNIQYDDRVLKLKMDVELRSYKGAVELAPKQGPNDEELILKRIEYARAKNLQACKEINRNRKNPYVCTDKNGVRSYSDTGRFAEDNKEPILQGGDAFMRGVIPFGGGQR